MPLVSTQDQQLDLQLNALKQVGCKQIFSDKLSSVQSQRLGLQEALSHLRETDLRQQKILLASNTPAREVAQSLNISVLTLYRWLPASNF